MCLDQTTRTAEVMTTTDKNNSEQINQILQMPPANVDQKFSARESLDHSWVREIIY